MKLLAIVDFAPTPSEISPASAAVLEEAGRWAKRLSARLWLLHVAEPDPEFVGYEPGPQAVREAVAERFREEHRRLQAEAARLRELGIETTAVLAQGPTVETILAEAAQLGVDAIIMGAHSHGIIHQLIVGSVSRGVLRRAACPVVTVPRPDK